jgi:outer membrane protein assembly factor BamB
MLYRALLSLSAVLVLSTHALADNWPQWRGPSANSVAGAGDFPTSWSGDENLSWKIKLPGKGSSTPAIWEDNIFVTYNVGPAANTIACLDRQGKEKWKVELGTAVPGKYGIASGANPSPVTDGTYVYVFFKSGDLACLDFDGTIVWHQNVQQLFGKDTSDTIWWDLGTSPVLTRRSVVLAYQRSAAKKEGAEKPPTYSDNSFVVAFDRKSGDVNWKQDRNLKAPRESAQSYTTPLVINNAAQQTVVVLGADYVTAHDATSGKEVWKYGTLNPNHEQYWRSIASATFADGYIFAPYARGGTLTAIKLGGTGDITESHNHWVVKNISSDCASPIASGGKVYSGTDRGQLTCVDIASGEIEWQIELEKSGKRYKSSPILAGDRIYWAREDGAIFVVQVGTEPKIVSKNEMGESMVATPVLVDGQLFLRTLDHLYCIGK